MSKSRLVNALALKVMVIGVGAAGNKAAMSLIENETIRKDEVLLINTTFRDKPENFDIDGRFINISDNADDGGSAKEPKIATELTIKAIKTGRLNLGEIIPIQTDLVILIGSLEGGTGNGAIPIIAKFIKDSLGFPVHILAIKGFGTDARGMDNTVNFFKKMQPNYAISCIDNCKFLSDANNNFRKAELLANDEIVNRIWTLKGHGIIPSDQNIDEKEIRKIATRDGFCTIEYCELPDDLKLKNVQAFNNFIKEMIDESKSLDISKPSQKCMGVIINLPENEAQYIDIKFQVIKDNYGTPFEVYPHIGYSSDMPRFISFICTGMKLPSDEIKGIMENFRKEFESIDISKDDFFDELKSFDDVPSNIFDMEYSSKVDTNDNLDELFKDIVSEDKPKKKGKSIEEQI